MRCIVCSFLFIVLSVSAIQAQSISVVEALCDSVARDTTDWRSMMRLAHYYRDRANTVRTLRWAERAYAIHPSDTIKHELATCYYQRADYQRCIELCRELLTPTDMVPVPDSSEVYLMARCFERLEMVDSTLRYMALEAERNIENQSNLVSLSKLLIGNKMAKRAVDYLERYSEIDSANNAVNATKALAYYNAGYPRKAINEYNRLVDGGDHRPSTLYYLGMSYLQVDRKYDALECFRKCNDIYNGNNGLTLAMLGLVELDFDTLAVKGENDIKNAIELMQPDSNLLFRLYFGLGDYYASLSDYRKALDYFRMAGKCKPESSELSYQLGYCYYMVGDVDNEYLYWSRYLELVGDDGSFVTQGVRQRIDKIKEERFMKGEEI